MPEPTSSRSRLSRWLRRLLLVAVGLALLGGLAVASVPWLLSSAWVRGLATREASRALGRDVSLEGLEASWSGRFAARGLRVADLPAFAAEPLLALGRLELRVDPLALLQRRLVLELELERLELRVVRDASGRSNVEALLEAPGLSGPAPEPAAPPPAAPRAPLPLAEAFVRVRVRGVTVSALDQGQGRRAAVRDAALDLDLASLGAPLTAALRAGLSLDGRELPPLRLDLEVAGWLGPDRIPDPGALRARVEGKLPGGELDLRADLGEAQASGKIGLDLAALLDFAQPFLPTDVAQTRMAGRLELTLQGSGRPGGPLAFDVSAAGTGLGASGPLLRGQAVGPADLRLAARGRVEPGARDLSVEVGEVSLLGRTRLAWTARAQGLGTPAARFEAALGPASLDLGELLALAAPFVPPEARPELDGASLGFERLALSGPVPAPDQTGARHSVTLAGLALELRTLRAAAGEAAVGGRGVSLRLERLETELQDLFPTSLELRASLAAEGLELAGPQPLALEGLSVPTLAVSLADLRRVPGSPGVALRGTLQEALTLASARGGALASVQGLRQGVRLSFSLDEAGRLEAEATDLLLSAQALSARPEGADAALAPAGESPGLELRVAAARAATRLDAPADAPRLALEGLSFLLPDLRARAGKSSTAARGLRLAVASLSTDFRQGFPGELTLRASMGAESLNVEGPAGAAAEGLEVADLELRASGLEKAEEALFGVAGRVSLRQGLTARVLDAPPHGRAEGVRQGLAAEVELARGPEVRVGAGELGLDVARARAPVPDRGDLEAPLALEARWESARLRGPGELRADLEGLRLAARAGSWLRVEASGRAAGSGREALATAGSANVDLGGVLGALPGLLPAGKASGAVRLRWEAEARLPTEEELQGLRADPGRLAGGQPLGFLEAASASLELERTAADLTLGDGERVSLAGVSTPEPLSLSVRRGGREVAAGGVLEAPWIEALPGLGTRAEPLRARLALRAERGPEGVLRATQSLEIEPLALAQEAELTLGGLDRLLRRGLSTPPALWLHVLAGEARANLTVGKAPELGELGGGVELRGPLEAGVRVRLTRGEELAAALTLQARDAAVGLEERLALDGLRADVALEKRYALRRVATAAEGGPAWLSEGLVRPEGTGRLVAALPGGPARYGGASTLGFASLRAFGGPVPVELRGLDVAFRLAGGLPAVERFQVGALGGFLVGSLELLRQPRGEGFAFGARVGFTGLDAARLVPGGAPLPRGEDAELSGRLALSLPLATELPAVLGGAELEAELTHVGSRVLDRALYALDPSESNEAIVKQRRLVRLGGPRWVRVGLRHGNLSLAGEVEVAGVGLELPRVERLNVAEVPGLEPFGAGLAGLGPVLRALEAASAEVLEVDDAGALRFRQGGDR